VAGGVWRPKGTAVRWGVAALVVMLGGFVVFHNTHHGAAAARDKGRGKGQGGGDVPVVVERAAVRDVPIVLNGIGTVTALSVVEVKVRVDGQIQKLAFTEGQEVKAGDLLAQIDPRPFEALRDEAEATRAKDQATLDNAKLDVQRYGDLIDSGGVSAQTLEASRSQVRSLEAAVRADQATIDTARLQLEFTRLVSPIDGRVGLRQVNAGAIVHTTDTTGIVTVTQMRPVSVIFSLPQDQLADVLLNSAKGKLPVTAYTRDGSRSLATGELTVVDSQVDSTTGQVRLRATFANDDRTLWPGSLVSVRIRVTTEKDATVMPVRALMRSETGQFVYVVKKDRTVEARPVTTGQPLDAVVTVRSGLEPGEIVVVDGQERLAPGNHVHF
jgi:membrane fusion protein, multidrug efflux system